MRLIIKKDGTKEEVEKERFHSLWESCMDGNKKYIYDRENDNLIEQ